MRRVLVVGSTGAGKSTLARALGERLDLPYHEVDALHFAGPGWAEDPRFATRVAEIAATPAWVLDSYGTPEVRPLLWERADTVLWLDYPRRVVMPRVLRRSLRRTVLRERIFHGNRETLTEWFRPDHPARWAWSQYASRRAALAALTTDPAFTPLHTLRFTAPRETRRWLSALENR
ncbi:adenylate kinase [Streptomyces sp. CB01201]|uniref:adenylate kinase n=1 Tax=Streptomyces sp. CB01201 TaxID=2020324 RepID=UPI000C26DC2C|nr:adenylate kinase [Streptomyces sp. CB01201]PJN03282.1 adenylate kinase [Streptomyces sp. CB01201]